MRKCEVCGSTKHVRKYLQQQILCGKHHRQMHVHGKILKKTIFDKNDIIDHGDWCELILYNREQQEVGRTKVSKEDLPQVAKYKWGLRNSGYAGNKTTLLHHFILGKKKGLDVDHINTDKLDNRRDNLRFTTHAQNMWNRKNPALGVTWAKREKKWVAQIGFKNKVIGLGYFNNKQDAIDARIKGENLYYGKYSPRNRAA